MSFQTGEIVLYGTEGICKVIGTEEKRFGQEALMYYVLESVGKGSRIFVPFSNPTLVGRIRRPLCGDEMQVLFASLASLEEIVWIANDRERKTAYAALVANGKTADLLALMKTVQNRRAAMAEMGKKLYASDDRCYRDARALLVAEMTVSLGVDTEGANAALAELRADFALNE